MCSARDNAALPALGLPIRESTGQRSFNTSPWLIAVVHALHRLLVPRHPPCALFILTVINSNRTSRPIGVGDTQLLICLANCAVFKDRARARPGDARLVSQNSTACVRLEHPEGTGGAFRSGSVDILGTPAVFQSVMPCSGPTGSLVGNSLERR